MLHFISPFIIAHLLSFIMSILSRFCWNAEVVICKAISNWSISCCYCHLLPETVKGLLTACSMEWSDMSGGGWNMRSHLSADRNRPSLKCKVCRWSWRECTSFILLLHMAKLLPVGRLRRQDWVPMTPGGVFISQLCRINLCPRAFWKIQKFYVALYQPIYYCAPPFFYHVYSF